MIEIQVSSDEDEAFVKALSQDGKLSDLLGGRSYSVVRVGSAGDVGPRRRAVAGGGSTETVFYGGSTGHPNDISGFGGGGGGDGQGCINFVDPTAGTSATGGPR